MENFRDAGEGGKATAGGKRGLWCPSEDWNSMAECTVYIIKDYLIYNIFIFYFIFQVSVTHNDGAGNLHLHSTTPSLHLQYTLNTLHLLCDEYVCV